MRVSRSRNRRRWQFIDAVANHGPLPCAFVSDNRYDLSCLSTRQFNGLSRLSSSGTGDAQSPFPGAGDRTARRDRPRRNPSRPQGHSRLAPEATAVAPRRSPLDSSVREVVPGIPDVGRRERGPRGSPRGRAGGSRRRCGPRGGESRSHRGRRRETHRGCGTSPPESGRSRGSVQSGRGDPRRTSPRVQRRGGPIREERRRRRGRTGAVAHDAAVPPQIGKRPECGKGRFESLSPFRTRDPSPDSANGFRAVGAPAEASLRGFRGSAASALEHAERQNGRRAWSSRGVPLPAPCVSGGRRKERRGLAFAVSRSPRPPRFAAPKSWPSCPGRSRPGSRCSAPRPARGFSGR